MESPMKFGGTAQPLPDRDVQHDDGRDRSEHRLRVMQEIVREQPGQRPGDTGLNGEDAAGLDAPPPLAEAGLGAHAQLGQEFFRRDPDETVSGFAAGSASHGFEPRREPAAPAADPESLVGKDGL
jgi:hypothetical protein